MTEQADESPDQLLLAREARDLRERIEDQFIAHQILQRRFVELLREQGVNIKPILITDQIPRLLHQPGVGNLETERFEAAPRSYGESWWPTGNPELLPLAPQTGWSSYSMRPTHAKALGISVCGMSKKKKQHIVEMIARRQNADKDFRPVFLTDSTDLTIFIPFGFVAEYIPSTPARNHTRTDPEWAQYISERRDSVIRKWELQEIIQFGPVPFGR